MTADSPKGPERQARPGKMSLRDRIAQEISKVDGHASSVEPCGDATYEQMADAALTVMEPEYEWLSAEVDRQHRLAGGWWQQSQENGRYAERLREQLATAQEELVAQNRLYRKVGAERDEKQFEVERLRRWVDRFRAALKPSMDGLSEEEAALIEEAMRAVEADSAGHWPTVAGWLHVEVVRLRGLLAPRAPVSESVPATPQPQRIFVGGHSLKAMCQFCDSSATSFDTATDRYHFANAPSEARQLQANSKLEQNLDEGRPSGSGAAAPQPVAEYRCDQPAHSAIPCPRCEPIVDGGAKFLGDRWHRRRGHPRCTGISSDALALLGVGAINEVSRDSYPQDYGDLGACERTFDMAPPHIQDRMAEQLILFREHVRNQWPNYKPEQDAAQAARSEATPEDPRDSGPFRNPVAAARLLGDLPEVSCTEQEEK